MGHRYSIFGGYVVRGSLLSFMSFLYYRSVFARFGVLGGIPGARVWGRGVTVRDLGRGLLNLIRPRRPVFCSK